MPPATSATEDLRKLRWAQSVGPPTYLAPTSAHPTSAHPNSGAASARDYQPHPRHGGITGSHPRAFFPPTEARLSYRCATVAIMAVRKKRSISMPPDLDAEIAAEAARAGMSYSAWLADTARKEFAIRAGLAAVSQFERDHGTFTPEEASEAEEWVATALERASRTGSSRRRTA